LFLTDARQRTEERRKRRGKKRKERGMRESMKRLFELGSMKYPR